MNMATRVDSSRVSAGPANDLLKVLPAKVTDASSSAQPFKKELDKAQRASEKPKPEAKAEETEKKKPSRAEKKSDVKAKKPAKDQQADADDQPVDEVDQETQAQKPQDADHTDETADDADDVGAKKPVDPAKVKAEPKTTDKLTDTNAVVLAAAHQQVKVKDDATEQAGAETAAKDSQAKVVRAVQPASAEKPQAADAKADPNAVKKSTDDVANGKIDLSQIDDSQSDDDDDADVTDVIAKTAAKTRATSDADDAKNVQQTTTKPEPKVASLDSQQPVIQPVQQQSQKASNSNAQSSDQDDASQASAAIQVMSVDADESAKASGDSASKTKVSTPTSDGAQFASLMPKTPDATAVAKPAAPAPQPPVPPEVQFATANHDKIITGLKTELLPNGGTMHIRLDPPELGALQVKVSMQDGVMTASFETSNDDATKLLSHSLTQLKHALESQGVSVDKLHVQQSPRNESSSNQKDENGQSKGQADNQRSAQQEQQRKEMIRRMWAKLGVIQDPLDMVA